MLNKFLIILFWINLIGSLLTEYYLVSLIGFFLLYNDFVITNKYNGYKLKFDLYFKQNPGLLNTYIFYKILMYYQKNNLFIFHEELFDFYIHSFSKMSENAKLNEEYKIYINEFLTKSVTEFNSSDKKNKIDNFLCYFNDELAFIALNYDKEKKYI